MARPTIAAADHHGTLLALARMESEPVASATARRLGTVMSAECT